MGLQRARYDLGTKPQGARGPENFYGYQDVSWVSQLSPKTSEKGEPSCSRLEAGPGGLSAVETAIPRVFSYSGGSPQVPR